MPRLNPLNDIAFTKCFGEQGCEPQTIALLNAILERTGRNTITEVSILPHKALLPYTVEGKTSVLDVHAKTEDGTKFIVEIQRKNEYNMDRRTLFYWSREYMNGINAGQDYRDVPDVVAINILDFSYLDVDDYHTSFHLWEDRNKNFLLTTAEEIHFIELPKFRKLAVKDIKGNPLHRWLSFLDLKTPLEAVEEIMLTDAAIKNAIQVMEELNKDEALYHAYTLYQMTLMDEVSRKAQAERDRVQTEQDRVQIARERAQVERERTQIGQEGLEKGLHEVARKLKAMGEPLEKIASATGLSPEEIEKLDYS
jgi:predicted transposase/invertase (TIGR01784 family)